MDKKAFKSQKSPYLAIFNVNVDTVFFTFHLIAINMYAGYSFSKKINRDLLKKVKR